MRRGWGRRAHAVPMHDAGTGRADRATARRPLREPARNRRGRPHLSDSESAVPLEDRQNDADAGVEEQSSCNAGDAYQGAFGVREVTDDKAVR